MSVRHRICATALAALCAISVGNAIEPPRQEAPTSATRGTDAWRRECGECHVAYPARLLPARSWKSIMDGLDRHFGVDASLDPATTASIREGLERGGARDSMVAAGPPSMRITTTPWFRREHRELASSQRKRAGARSFSDCGACHADAAAGRFEERALRWPFEEDGDE
jgi:hypothetical protein